MQRRLVLLVLATCLPACSRAGSGGASVPPEGAVTEYFSALERGDCDAVQRAAGGELLGRIRAHGCDAALDDYRVHGMRLVRIEGATPDGRAPNAVLVRTILTREGKEAATVLRVEKLDGRWKLTVL